MIQDMRKALEKRNRIGMEKLILSVPKMYFEYHDRKNTLGLVIRKAKKYRAFWLEFGFVPSYHIAFVSEDYVSNNTVKSMENKGVISHEIGHTLGQWVEFYEKDTDGDGFQDRFEYCKEIWGGSIQNCQEHEITRAFSNLEDYRGVINDSSTIMSNALGPHATSNWMQSKWIDRDTYQKSFRYLKRPDTEQKESLQWLDRFFGERQNIVTFSGLYIKKGEEFVTVPDEYYPTVKGSRAGFTTEDDPFGDLLLELRYRQKIVSSLKFETDMEIEFLRADGSGQIQSLDIVPVVVSLPITDEYYGNMEELEIVVSRIDAQGNKLRELFRQRVRDWQR